MRLSVREAIKFCGTGDQDGLSFGLHAGGLYDWPPFPVIGTNLGVELRRRAADRRRAKLGQALLDGPSVQGRDEIMREVLNQVARHAGRSEQSPPHLGVVA